MALVLSCSGPCDTSAESRSDESSNDDPSVVDVACLLEAAWTGLPAAAAAPGRCHAASGTTAAAPVHPMLIPSNRAFSHHSSALSMGTCGPSLPSKRPHDGDGPSHSGVCHARSHTPHGSLNTSHSLADSINHCSSTAPIPKSSAPLPAPGASTGIKARVAGGDAGPGDFASVFFSPIPLSCLHIARSGSLDSNLTGSLGSLADGSVRPGSLTAAVENAEWEEEAAAAAAISTPAAAAQLLFIPESDAVVSVQQQEPSKFKADLLEPPVSPDSVLEPDAQLALDGQCPAPPRQVDSSPVRPAAPAPSRSAPVQVPPPAAVERQGDAPPPALAGRSTTSPSGKCITPLAPAGLHPIMSRPPASSCSSAAPSSHNSPDSKATALSPLLPQPTLPPSPPAAPGAAALGGAATASTATTAGAADAPSHLMHDVEVLPAVAMAGQLLQQQPPLGAAAAACLSIAAAAAAPATTTLARPLRMVAGTAMIPHIDKVDKGGEDALCVCLGGLGAIGVADGVSGWADEGIDPAAYSRALMQHASNALNRGAASVPGGRSANPREVIRYAHHATVMAGSSTICVAVMQPSGKLEVANLGDSGVRIIRDGRIVFASAAQQHMFNMPFQLSHPSIIESPDDADSADVNILDVQPGDIIVLATDGLYDNVFDEEIASICTHALAAGRRGPANGRGLEADARLLAETVAFTAHRYAQDPHQRTPWSVAASETGMPWARFFAKGGGKMDDITVVVAIVTEATA